MPEPWKRWRRVWWALSALVAAWLLWMTLRPNQIVAVSLSPLTEPAAARGISLYLLIELAGNILVFAPLGAAVSLALISRKAEQRLLLTTLVGAGLALIIELLQAALPTRTAQVSDWYLNTAGTFIGAVAGYWGSGRMRQVYYQEGIGK